MSHWNANGLVERKTVVRKPKKMKEIKEKIDKSKHSKEELAKIQDLEAYLNMNKSSLGGYGSRYLEEYIEVCLKPIISGNSIFEKYPYFKIRVKDSQRANYLSCQIDINFCADKNCEEVQTIVSVELRELFMNCSSIVISKLLGNILHNMYLDESKRPERDTFVVEYFKILEKVCTLIEYSIILYSCSIQETNPSVTKYLENNWKVIQEVTNKRTGNLIKYFTKIL